MEHSHALTSTGLEALERENNLRLGSGSPNRSVAIFDTRPVPDPSINAARGWPLDEGFPRLLIKNRVVIGHHWRVSFVLPFNTSLSSAGTRCARISVVDVFYRSYLISGSLDLTDPQDLIRLIEQTEHSLHRVEVQFLVDGSLCDSDIQRSISSAFEAIVPLAGREFHIGFSDTTYTEEDEYDVRMEEFAFLTGMLSAKTVDLHLNYEIYHDSECEWRRHGEGYSYLSFNWSELQEVSDEHVGFPCAIDSLNASNNWDDDSNCDDNIVGSTPRWVARNLTRLSGK